MVDKKILYFDAGLPHVISELICIKCGKRFICVRPDVELLLKNIECSSCNAIGFMIETGEDMNKVQKLGDENKPIEYIRKSLK